MYSDVDGRLKVPAGAGSVRAGLYSNVTRMRIGVMIEGQEGLTWERWFRVADRVEELGLDSRGLVRGRRAVMLVLVVADGDGGGFH